MSGINYLADTNCFIYLLDENPLLLPFAESRWAYSFITEIELLSKKGLTAKDDTLIRKMLATCYRFGHNQTITELSILLRRKYSIKLPDAIIAATAQSLQVPLLSADNVFSKIKEIDSFILEME
jgi:predicted nucleic acid-binding protein